MRTPDNRAGKLTEQIMFQATLNFEDAKLEPMTTSQYNRIYEAVYSILEREGVR